jgi:uncharacterized oxidoreductase
MQVSDNTVLITGGASGIGLTLAEALMASGSQVLICGRREDRLQAAQRKLPGVAALTCDIAEAEGRRALVEWVLEGFPRLNMLVNNAGIQRQIDLTAGLERVLEGDDEIDINLKAPILLTCALLPRLMAQPSAAVINISSGLGFAPLAFMPIYCATKAGLHSFSLSLRRQLQGTSVGVFEILPPTVDTELDRGARTGRGQHDRGIPPADVAQATMRALAEDTFELGIGRSEGLRTASRADLDQLFLRMNGGQ